MLELVQTFEKPDYNGYRQFAWSIIGVTENRASVGSFTANYHFPVAVGKTDKATLGNARRKLRALSKYHNAPCTFHYEKTD